MEEQGGTHPCRGGGVFRHELGPHVVPASRASCSLCLARGTLEAWRPGNPGRRCCRPEQ